MGVDLPKMKLVPYGKSYYKSAINGALGSPRSPNIPLPQCTLTVRTEETQLVC
jgi:hypothetical protein